MLQLKNRNLDSTSKTRRCGLHKRRTKILFTGVKGTCRELWESDLAHGLGVDEVVIAPDAGVIVILPLHVDIQVGEVVALRDGELLPHLITFLLAALQTHADEITV